MSDDVEYRQRWLANSGRALHSVVHATLELFVGSCASDVKASSCNGWKRRVLSCGYRSIHRSAMCGFVDVVKKTVVTRESCVRRRGLRVSLVRKTSKKGSMKPEVGIATSAEVLPGNAVGTHRVWTRGCFGPACVVEPVGRRSFLDKE